MLNTGGKHKEKEGRESAKTRTCTHFSKRQKNPSNITKYVPTATKQQQQQQPLGRRLTQINTGD